MVVRCAPPGLDRGHACMPALVSCHAQHLSLWADLWLCQVARRDARSRAEYTAGHRPPGHSETGDIYQASPTDLLVAVCGALAQRIFEIDVSSFVDSGPNASRML